MISTKKYGVGSKDNMGPFSLHEALKSSLAVLIEIRHAHFLTPLIMNW